jgi:hypothetical protein
MVSAIGVRTDCRTLRHMEPVISQVHCEQLGLLQQHTPNSSQQVRSNVALGIASGAVRNLLANDPNSEAGRKASELLRVPLRRNVPQASSS